MKRLIQMRAADLFPLAVPQAVFKRLLPTEVAAEPQLMLDTLCLAEVDGLECLINIEIQTQPDETMPRRLFEYGSRASIVHDGLPVVSVVIWLEKGKLPVSPYQMVLGNWVLATWHFVSIELFRLSASAIIKSGRLGVLPLIPFMQGADALLVEQAMRRVREEAPPEQSEALASLLAVFIDRVQGTALALTLLRRFGMSSDILRESGLVQILLRDERNQQARKMARAALAGRFGSLSEEVLQAISAADEATLTEVVAHPGESLEQVRQRLGLTGEGAQG
jgi:hypothetical protein